MIEVINEATCTGCNICVRACPTNVFELVRGQAPRIARQADCQTCFMCELYCPEDALYVAPDADHASHDASAQLESADQQALLGSYRKAIGWGKGRTATATLDPTFELLQRAH